MGVLLSVHVKSRLTCLFKFTIKYHKINILSVYRIDTKYIFLTISKSLFPQDFTQNLFRFHWNRIDKL